MDQRPRRSVFERLGRLPREYSGNNIPGSSGSSQALLGPGPAPLLRYPERSTHDLFQRNNRRRPNPNYNTDHYSGTMKKSRMDIGLVEKPPQPLLQLRQMPTTPVLQPEKKKKLRLKRRKPRPLDDTLDEGEIVDDEDEYEEYSDDDEDTLASNPEQENKDRSIDMKPSERGEHRILSLTPSAKECDALSLKSFDSSSDRLSHKLTTKGSSSSASNVHGSGNNKSGNILAESDKGSNYSDWSDDELLLRDDANNKDEQLKADRANNFNEQNDNDNELFVGAQNSGSQSKIQDLEAISDDDFDAYDQDLLERNKDCMEEMLMSDLVVTNDVSINDILAIDWKSLLPSTNHQQRSQNTNNNNPPSSSKDSGESQQQDQEGTSDEAKQRRNSVENRTNKTKCCLEMLNRIGHSTSLAGRELSQKIEQTLREQLQNEFLPQTDKLAFLHHSRYRKILEQQKKQQQRQQNSLSTCRVQQQQNQHSTTDSLNETTPHFHDELSLDSPSM